MSKNHDSTPGTALVEPTLPVLAQDGARRGPLYAIVLLAIIAVGLLPFVLLCHHFGTEIAMAVCMAGMLLTIRGAAFISGVHNRTPDTAPATLTGGNGKQCPAAGRLVAC